MFPLLAALLLHASAVPETSLAVHKHGRCGPPDFSCLSLVNRTTPKARAGEVLIKVSGSSINPDEISILKVPLVDYTPGLDVSGTVADVGLGVKTLKVGDRVWTMFATGGMAEYTTRLARLTAKVPENLDLTVMGTLPTVAMTSLGALEAAGAPWAEGSNISVLVTGGTGGTGYTAVQLAKCMGAARVVTAVGPDNIDFAKSLDVDVVVDYHQQSVFDAVADGSIDVVLNNHDSAGNADRAMQKLRAPGGVYVTVAGDVASNPPEGIKQISYSLWGLEEFGDWINKMDLISSCISSGKMRIDIEETFDFDHVKEAYAAMADGHVRSKLSVVPQSGKALQLRDSIISV